MDCTKKIISWLYGEGVNAQTRVSRIGELGQFVQSKKKRKKKKKYIDFVYVKREGEKNPKVKSLQHCTAKYVLILY